MTIRFNCPNCNELIAFADEHSGKRAHCTTCDQQFIIPSGDKEKTKKIKSPKEKGEPLPGFYRAVFNGNLQLFTNLQNVTGLVFIAVAVCLKFFTAGMNYTLTIPGQAYNVDLPLPVGHVLHVAVWGFLFWYYMKIIYAIAFEQEKLPDVIVGGFNGLVWLIAKSVYIFIIYCGFNIELDRSRMARASVRSNVCRVVSVSYSYPDRCGRQRPDVAEARLFSDNDIQGAGALSGDGRAAWRRCRASDAREPVFGPVCCRDHRSFIAESCRAGYRPDCDALGRIVFPPL